MNKSASAVYPADNEIYIPEKKDFPSAEIPVIGLSERQAVEQGWSFRKKTKNVRITNYHGTERRIVIPSKIGGLPVNEIGREAFAVKNIANAPDIEQIMIPDSVKKIGDRAFSRSEVRNIIFGNGVKSIPKEAFLLCRRLENVRLSAVLVSIGESAFRLCENLRYIIFPNSIKDIGKEAFFRSGLEGFAAKSTFFLNDACAFASTPMHKKYKLVLKHKNDYCMDVFMVGVGANVRFPHNAVTLGTNAAQSRCILDFSQCKSVFLNDSFPDVRNEYGCRHIANDIKVIVPKGVKHLYFPDYVDARYSNGKPYGGMYEITENSTGKGGRKIIIKPHSHMLPSWSVETGAEEIKLLGTDTSFKKYTFSEKNLKRVEMGYFAAYGEIFSPVCRSLREVRWFDHNGEYVQYIPPAEIIGEALHRELIKAFGGSQDILELFDRRRWDEIFTRGNIEYPIPPEFTHRRGIKKLTQRDHILIAADVIRSKHGQNKSDMEIYEEYPDMEIYEEYLRTHLRYAKIVCEKVRSKYPEYANFIDMYI